MTLIKGLSANPWGRMDPKSLQTIKAETQERQWELAFWSQSRCQKMWEQNICVHEKGELFLVWLGMLPQTGILSELVKTSYSMCIVTNYLLPHNN